MKYYEWIKLMNSSESSDRVHAADEFPDDGPEDEICRQLMLALSDPYALVRTCAADSVSACSGEVVRSAVRAALNKETDELARSHLISAIGAVGDISDAGTVIAILRSQEETSLTKTHCAGALIALVTRLASSILTEALYNKNKQLASNALNNIAHAYDELQGGAEQFQHVVETWRDSGASKKIDQEAIAAVLEHRRR